MLSLNNVRRDVAARELFADVAIQLHDPGIRAIIGRNGEGKSTLLKILAGVDRDFEGERLLSRGETIAFTAQESQARPGETTRNYIKRSLPSFQELNELIEDGERLLSGTNADLHRYGDALDRFTELGYFTIDADIERHADTVELDPELLDRPYDSLSGGQQKLADLIMVMASPASMYLFDEPTNHMDSVAKANFISWMRQTGACIVIVTHDRDVLEAAQTIYELKDRRLIEYPGNYTSYLRQNRVATSSTIHQYEVDVRSLENVRKQLVEAERKKLRSKSSPNPFVPLVERLKREVRKLEDRIERPSAWIDQRSIADLKPDERRRYERYKSGSIGLRSHHVSARGSGSMLIACEDIVLGYGTPLFKPISFRLARGGRLRLAGRNGVGKTTLINTITEYVAGRTMTARSFAGTITCAPKLSFGEYRQHGEHVAEGTLLGEAVEAIYAASGKEVNETVIRRALAQFLFDPAADIEKEVAVLSGGEKARLYLMKLLLQAPDIMVLDEPTNHLDLPSIEELEGFLNGYDGAVLYVSHDSYFADALGGETVLIEPA